MKHLERLTAVGRRAFTLNEVTQRLGLPQSSIRVCCSRAVQRGALIRIRKGLYILPQTWSVLDEEERFTLANFIQTPSYVTLLSALSYHGVTTQIPPHLCESVSPVRRSEYAVLGFRFVYYLIGSRYYQGFHRERGFFMAEPEKAFLDLLHLSVFGTYAFDRSSLDLHALDAKRLRKWLGTYPPRVRSALERLREGS